LRNRTNFSIKLNKKNQKPDKTAKIGLFFPFFSVERAFYFKNFIDFKNVFDFAIEGCFYVFFA